MLQIIWDKYSLQIDNKKIFLLGGEFHYWRVVLACWTTERDQLAISIKPYSIKKDSGNIDENGSVFISQKFTIPLG